MHIGFLTTEYPSTNIPHGGIANYTQRIARLLVLRGHTVSVIVLSNATREWTDQQVYVYEIKQETPAWLLALIKAILLLKFPVLINCIPGWLQIISAKQVEREVWRIHAQMPFDIIQCPNYRTPGYTLKENRKIPLVCRVSSYGPMWRAVEGKQRTFADTYCDWLEMRQVLDSDSSFAPSQFLVTTFERLESHKLSLLRTPVDPIHTKLDPSYFNQYLKGKKYILYFGSFTRMKGVDLLTEAVIPILVKNSDLFLVMIGPDHGAEDLRTNIIEKAETFQVGAQVKCSKALPKTQLFTVIKNALFIVLPSRVDNFPNACLEAQLLGKIVIGTYESSLDEMIVDCQTGFLVKNGDVLCLREAIQSTLEMTPEQRLAMEARILQGIELIEREDRVTQIENFYFYTIKKFRKNLEHEIRS